MGKPVQKVYPMEWAPNQEAIYLIEDLLERCKSGEVKDVAIACVLQDRSVTTAYTCDHGGCLRMLGVLDMLRKRLLEAAEDGGL